MAPQATGKGEAGVTPGKAAGHPKGENSTAQKGKTKGKGSETEHPIRKRVTGPKSLRKGRTEQAVPEAKVPDFEKFWTDLWGRTGGHDLSHPDIAEWMKEARDQARMGVVLDTGLDSDSVEGEGDNENEY